MEAQSERGKQTEAGKMSLLLLLALLDVMKIYCRLWLAAVVVITSIAVAIAVEINPINFIAVD